MYKMNMFGFLTIFKKISYSKNGIVLLSISVYKLKKYVINLISPKLFTSCTSKYVRNHLNTIYP